MLNYTYALLLENYARRLPQTMKMLSSAERSIESWFETQNVAGLYNGHSDIVINTT